MKLFQNFYETVGTIVAQVAIGELKTINRKLDTIMATQAQLAKQLNDLGVELGKIGNETQALLDKIDALGVIIAQGGEVTPELQAAFDAVKAQAQAVDDKVPDPVPVPPTP